MNVLPGMPEHGGIGDRLKRLEVQVDKLSRARKLESASIGSGGLTIKDGGVIEVVRDNGTTAATLDKTSLTFYAANGTTPVASLDTGGIVNQINVEATQTVLAETEFTSTSFAEVIAVNVTIPTIWSQYLIRAWFVGTYSDTGGTLDTLQLRARYNNVAGDTRVFGMPEPTERRYPISHLEQWTGQTVTGSRSIDVQAALVTGGGGRAFGLQNAKLLVNAQRTG